jgi:flagellar motor switch protein FliN/FliY
MSEVNIDQEPGKNTEADADEDISWADALEDLERQKLMLKEQGQQHAKREHAPEQIAAAGKGEGALPNLKFILDIPLQVTVELGRKRLLVHDLLQLSQGSIIELTKQIGEPFEVLVNQKLIARGEVVVINDKFGVRITDIISPMERVQQL